MECEACWCKGGEDKESKRREGSVNTVIVIMPILIPVAVWFRFDFVLSLGCDFFEG